MLLWEALGLGRKVAVCPVRVYQGLEATMKVGAGIVEGPQPTGVSEEKVKEHSEN